MIVIEAKGNVVYVVGQVTKPGAITMNPTINVLQALSIAGGANPYAKLDCIIVIRSSGGTQRVLPFKYGQVSSRQGSGAEYSAGERRCRGRSVAARRRSGIRPHVIAVLVCATNAVLAAPTLAEQFYVQPTATLTAENDSNLDLDPGPSSAVQGYSADAGALFGIATPNSESTIRARLDYRDYPKDQGDDRLEEYLDFRSDYSTQRSHAAISGTIDHRDDFNAEFSSAYFDQINPVQPTNPSTGQAVTGEAVTTVLLQPSYSYKFSPVISAGVSAIYQRLTYTPSFFDQS